MLSSVNLAFSSSSSATLAAKTALTCHCRSNRSPCAGLPLFRFSRLSGYVPCLPCQPAEDLRKGCFPRAVLPRYGGHAALWNRQRNILKNDFLAYSFREPAVFKTAGLSSNTEGAGGSFPCAESADPCPRCLLPAEGANPPVYTRPLFCVPQIQKSVCDPHQTVDPMLRDEQGKALLLELPEGLLKLLRPGGIEVGRRLIAHKDL